MSTKEEKILKEAFEIIKNANSEKLKDITYEDWSQNPLNWMIARKAIELALTSKEEGSYKKPLKN